LSKIIEAKIVYKTLEQLAEASEGDDFETIESMLLSEWLAENYINFGLNLQLITDKSSEGFQFVKGFGGIGGFLRYKVALDGAVGELYEEDDDEDFI